MTARPHVIVCDTGPRDGLQNEATILAPEVRAELCNRLIACGLERIEAVSFVNPSRVPQMAGAEQVLAGIRGRGPRPTSISGLVLNRRGFERAVAAGVDEVHYAFPVTDSFALRNQNTTREGGLETAVELLRRAREARLPFTVTLSVAFGCPFEGAVDPGIVVALCERLAEAGCEEIVLADTIGVAVPTQVSALTRRVAGLGVRTGGHFHNTRNTGYANAVAALESGATVLDASVGGTGGCPFAPRATGNIATEDLVYLLHGMGIPSGIDLERLASVAVWLGRQLGKELPGMLAKAGDFPAVSAAAG